MQSRPIGYWPLDEPAGAGYVKDHAGGQRGQVQGQAQMGLVPGPLNGTTAMSTPGGNCDGISLDKDAGRLHPPNAVTVEAWIQTTNQSSLGDVFRARDGGYNVLAGVSGLTMTLYPPSETYNVSANLTDGVWHYVAASYDDQAGFHLYVDGVSVGDSASVGSLDYNGSEVAIGRDGDACNGVVPSFQGNIAQVAVYDYPLGATQVARHYLAGSVGTKGGILALGDSVAAGYGLGQAHGYPDNSNAYPALIASSLGTSVRNYAVENACASHTKLYCDPASVDWQILQVPQGYKPGIITLTVGADDIDFADCLKSVLEDFDFDLQASKDPCNPKRLAASLDTFQTGLTSDLVAIAQQYPDTPILVMQYYNPFPPDVPEGGSPCSLYDAETLFYAHSQGNRWRDIAIAFLTHYSQFEHEATSIQDQVFDDASSIVTQLNASIGQVVDTLRVSGLPQIESIATNFQGHDICESGSEWAFPPGVHVRVWASLGQFSAGLGSGAVCPGPYDKQEWNIHGQAEFGLGPFKGGIKATIGTNCIPHPTWTGQWAIARDFI